jgi:hypothetical protein
VSACCLEKLPANCTPQGASGASGASPTIIWPGTRSSRCFQAALGPRVAGRRPRLARLFLGSPVLDGSAGDEPDVVPCFLTKLASPAEPCGHAVRTAVVGRRCQAQVAEPGPQVRQEPCGFWDGLLRVERSRSPRSLAVRGMNWATPCAPAWLTTPGRKLLSRQIKRVKKAGGSWCELAAPSIRRHIACATDSDFRSSCGWSGAAAVRARASSAPLRLPPN